MMEQQKIIPNLWFDGAAEEAAHFYTEIFPDGRIVSSSRYPNSTAEGLADFQQNLAGKVLTVDFSLADCMFVGINAGPEFKATPANSFMVNFDPSRDPQAREHLDELWGKLLDGGEALMALERYSFSDYYGWVKDKYGFSWQLILTDPNGEPRPFIVPAFMFGSVVQNRAAEAIDYYLQVFKDAKMGTMAKYEAQVGPATPGSVMFADFMLQNQWFVAMDSGGEQDFTFTEAVSFVVNCADQAEIDYFWEKLSHYPENEQCGWCKDKFGVSWQIVPENMEELMQKPNAFATLMQQKKIVVADF